MKKKIVLSDEMKKRSHKKTTLLNGRTTNLFVNASVNRNSNSRKLSNVKFSREEIQLQDNKGKERKCKMNCQACKAKAKSKL
ncbi:hypothetical protein [Priestia megaterium]|uniref:hypothetical protein n=1 Tax=Priestia megaterium TaxID=1404 RepID=UPI000BEBC39D|nr:hypothetical protein [Priestia megaterium]MDP9579525.1 hypothetical protein [Bacillus sp. 1751]MED4067004.1 hypothetical protein [Priestia megaterium]PEA36660.1 hypothetical protein CON45_23645 [Priestia megaterium]PEE49410.1 hypothetical protein COM71_00290 [Priestia megaterium]PFK43654.1 hypothetical protein COJ23_24730 [Priestia megaterium]